MTTTTAGAASSAPSSQASNGNTAARQAGGSAATSRPGKEQRSAVDLFANLLGLVSATRDAPIGLGTHATDASDALSDASDPDSTDALGNPLTSASANPLADLIGWTGAPTPAPSGSSLNTSAATGSEAGASKTNQGLSPAAVTTPSDAETGKGVSLQGMTVLAQATDADASLLASLKPGAANANALSNAAPVPQVSTDRIEVSIESSPQSQANQPTSAARANTIAATRPANWRSTATLGAFNPLANAPASNPTSTTGLQMAQSAAVRQGREPSAVILSPRTTVALDERFTSAVSADSIDSGTALGGAQSHLSQGNPPFSSQGEAAFGAASATELNDSDAPDQAFSLEAELSPEEELDPNAFLSPDRLRHASVRVGEGTAEAIDIRLSLEGDEVNVNFRTDNAEVRAGLQSQAGGSLSELMQRSGLQLGGVSVGSQSQQSAGQSGQSGQSSDGSHPQGRNPATNGGDRRQETSGSARAPIARRADGGPALDVFA